MKKIFIFFFILTLPFLTASSIVRADDVATDSAAQEASPDSEIRSNLETLIQNTVKQNLSSTEAELAKKVAQNKLVGFVGNITGISTESLTFKSKDDIFQVGTTDKTTFNKSNQNVKFTSLAIGDKAIVMGLLPKSDIIDAKRIVIIKDAPIEMPQVIYGSVTSVSTKTRTVTLKDGDKETDLIVSRKANVSIADFEEGKKVVVIVHDQNGDLVITQGKIF